MRIIRSQGGGPVRRALPLFLLALALAAAPTVSAEGKGVAAFRDKLFDVEFVSGKEAWAVGYPGLVLHSTDGGDTWARVDAGTMEALFSIDFADPKTGWIAGRRGTILHTVDGGKTWTRQKTDTLEPLFSIDFANPQIGAAVGNFGQVLWTRDGGATWEKHEIEAMLNASLNAVVVLDENRAIVAGDYPGWELELVEGLDPGTISNVYRTEDGGATWEVVATGSTAKLYGLAFAADGRTGCAVGEQGELLTTADGAATWEKIPTGLDSHLVGLALGEDSVLAVGVDGVVLRVNPDRRPEAGRSGVYIWLAAVALGEGGRAVAVGGRGTLLVSGDGGRTWRPR